MNPTVVGIVGIAIMVLIFFTRMPVAYVMALVGWIDATALSRDDTAVRRTVMETAPPLLESGRYLPCLDDRPRPNTLFSLYSLYRELLSELALKG